MFRFTAFTLKHTLVEIRFSFTFIFCDQQTPKWLHMAQSPVDQLRCFRTSRSITCSIGQDQHFIPSFFYLNASTLHKVIYITLRSKLQLFKLCCPRFSANSRLSYIWIKHIECNLHYSQFKNILKQTLLIETKQFVVLIFSSTIYCLQLIHFNQHLVITNNFGQIFQTTFVFSFQTFQSNQHLFQTFYSVLICANHVYFRHIISRTSTQHIANHNSNNN